MTLYRVATANSYDTTIQRLQQRQAELAEQQDKLSSGKRVRRVSDDPAAAALAERERAREHRVQADQRALEAARRNLQLAESTLADIGDLYHRAKELIVQGGNGSLNPSDRATIAQELEGIRERILALANTKDTLGRPLFMGLGLASGTQSFQENLVTAAATTYGPDGRVVQENGLRGQAAATETGLPSQIDGYPVFSGRLAATASAIVSVNAGNSGTAVALDARVQNAAGLNTTQVFTLDDSTPNVGSYTLTYTAGVWTVNGTDKSGAAFGPVTATVTTVDGVTQLDFEGLRVRIQGTPANGDAFTVTPTVDVDVWESFDRAIGALKSENGHDLNQELAVVNLHLEKRLDRLLSARGQLGDWLNRADQMDAAFQARKDYHVQQQSDLTDLDMVEAISRFQTQQLGYQAALSSYAQVQRLSLFQYLA
ncbi:flagellar hook-associated protein FlgL [Tepidimonas taiwanensis]|uniref:Flagellar hook-associated protein 3 n=1 Tax=Tepidimonas taiwanensis TaxID=307486 RepID=A0A554XCF1_9BURK|nr:flagellar hook-associated protein FlgL [Tepidimonas taiwanensis]MCX7693282.1 flagellar hook-associated protein FlgL [Tepidimonas taiwanensis]MDM7464211.1 flagellar hook-associated protein FlgL [Tepidimonas taiwanensis]TSE33513.1 Flagellar hook-associated protein 3 [Tepidimonas taiwanensis]UBQ05785.1 flagellar hook-associated protein FlgL [Tepidimonas taiwanensis]